MLWKLKFFFTRKILHNENIYWKKKENKKKFSELDNVINVLYITMGDGAL